MSLCSFWISGDPEGLGPKATTRFVRASASAPLNSPPYAGKNVPASRPSMMIAGLESIRAFPLQLSLVRIITTIVGHYGSDSTGGPKLQCCIIGQKGPSGARDDLDW